MASKKDPAAGNDICDAMANVATELDKTGKKFENGITGKAIAANVDTARAKIKKIMELMSDVGKLVDEKNAVLKTLQAQRKLARQAVVGVFGDDSPEYAAVGGTRRSERKRPVRKPKV